MGRSFYKKIYGYHFPEKKRTGMPRERQASPLIYPVCLFGYGPLYAFDEPAHAEHLSVV